MSTIREHLEQVIAAYDEEASYVGFTVTVGSLPAQIEAARTALAEQEAVDPEQVILDAIHEAGITTDIRPTEDARRFRFWQALQLPDPDGEIRAALVKLGAVAP